MSANGTFVQSTVAWLAGSHAAENTTYDILEKPKQKTYKLVHISNLNAGVFVPVIEEEVELTFEITSTFMKHLVKMSIHS